jgi:putative DNA-invertase from lambdoid prophage Rac
MAHKREFDVLLFWSLDRLSREGTRATIQYLTQLEQDGVDWHSFTEQYLSSLGIFKDCIISLLSALARQEKIRISERTKAGLERTVKLNGIKLGRRPTPREKIQQAINLRKQGLSFEEIGREMGITRSRAHQLVQLIGMPITLNGNPASVHSTVILQS